MTGPREERDRAQIAAARASADAGDVAGAERAFLDLLARHRGSGSAVERLACSSLVTLYGRQRRLFETVTLAHRLRTLAAEPPPDVGAVAYAAFARATAWLGLDAVGRAAEDLERLAAALPGVAGDRGVLLGRMGHLLRSRLAVARGEADAARAHLARYEATYDALPPTPSDRIARHARRAEVCALEGRTDDGLAELAAARELASDVGDRVAIELATLDQLERSRRRGAIGERASALIALLDRALAEEPSASQLAWEGGRRLLAALTCVPGSGELQRRAWETLSTALLRRLDELRRAAELLPELRETDPEDRETFRGVKEESQRWLRALRGQLVPDLAPPVSEVPEDGVILRVCVWCDSIYVGGGRWLPMLESYDTAGPFPATHGMCSACAERAGRG